MNEKLLCSDFSEEHCAKRPQCHGCPAHKKSTNFARLKNMSVEELAQFLCEQQADCDKCFAEKYCYTGHNGIKYWLESEVTAND